MADEEQVTRLKQGADAWDEWRRGNPGIRPDLKAADLSRADLSRADLTEADLSRADLSRADLRWSDLPKAVLTKADLSGAMLARAILRDARLGRANLARADLGRADLGRADLGRADLSGADLSGAILRGADVARADLSEARLVNADLSTAVLRGANLSRANLSGADLSGADLLGVDLTGADLTGVRLGRAELGMADLTGANLSGASLGEAKLQKAVLRDANLRGANLSRAILRRADLGGTNLIGADLARADLTGARVHGVSAWRLNWDSYTEQKSLIITARGEPEITVDNIEVAQFIYLLLHNEKIRNVIDTITSKVVLILGRFTPQRKAVLDALQDELRRRDYLPILFDFDIPVSRDITETVSLLARMARFVLADITEAKSIPQELAAVVPDLPSVPVQPLLLEGSDEYGMFEHFKRYPWVLEIYRYRSPQQLIENLSERVIGPAETKAAKLRGTAARQEGQGQSAFRKSEHRPSGVKTRQAKDS